MKPLSSDKPLNSADHYYLFRECCSAVAVDSSHMIGWTEALFHTAAMVTNTVTDIQLLRMH